VVSRHESQPFVAIRQSGDNATIKREFGTVTQMTIGDRGADETWRIDAM
jgi:hypothetical protein